MCFRIVSLLALLSISSIASATGALPAGPPQIRFVEGTAGIEPVYAAIGENPLYQGQSNAGQNPLYQGQDRVSPPGMSNVGYPSVNAKGDIAFKSLSLVPEATGIYVRPRGGNILLTVRGEAFGQADGAPVINNANQVVFKGLSDLPGGGLPVVKLATPSASGFVITIVGAGYSQVNAPDMDDQGNVAFTGTTADTGERALFVYPASGNVPITVRGEGFGDRVQLSDPPSGLPTGRRIFTPFVTPGGGGSPPTSELVSYDIDLATGAVVGPVRWMPPEVLTTKTNFAVLLQGNDAGKKVAVSTGNSILLCGETDHFRSGPGLPSISTQTLVSVGDLIEGLAITELDLAPQSWGSDTSLTFWAELSDGSSGLYIYTLPEPASLGALAIVGALLRRRR
jgi:hypothetical protein